MYSQIKHFHLPDVQQACELMRIISAAKSVYHPRKIDRPLALYGAGDLGRLARKFLDKLKIPIEFVVDVRAKKVRKDPFWDGVQIVSPDQVGQKERKNNFVSSCSCKCAILRYSIKSSPQWVGGCHPIL